jgi:hypothetical protein
MYCGARARHASPLQRRGVGAGHARPAELTDKSRGQGPGVVLTINGGSSRIRFALYQTAGPLKRSLQGEDETQ